ncbi:MAG: histidine--tRNA ligase, partial [Candidatus Andersenbacteria bacterium CG10_big_fil_rev_8_21_14_0_10_54_11]
GLRSWPKPIKLCYAGPFFRYDRPQAGRYRQFHQFGMEVFGSAAPVTDAQLMYVQHVLLRQLGLEEYVFLLNTLGDQADRTAYIRALKEHYRRHVRKLCRDCKARLKTNPLRVLDCKEEKCQQVAYTAPRLLDTVSDEAQAHFTQVRTLLDELKVPYEIAPGLVRGLDYYVRTVWEVVPRRPGDPPTGSQTSLGAGGRYDHLVKALGGKDVPAAGGAFGIERLIDAIRREGIDLQLTDTPSVFVAQLGAQAKVGALRVMRLLQEAQIRFAESIDRDGIQPQLKLAERLNVAWVVVVGQKEVIDGTVILRNAESGMQEVVRQEDLVTELRRRLNVSQG